MKTLVVNTRNSVFKYPRIYEEYEFEITLEGTDRLTVHKRDSITGHNSIVGCFKTWDYFLIEEDDIF